MWKNMKRKAIQISNMTLADIKAQIFPLIDDQWISATKIRNYLLKDPMLDWLQMYGEQKGFTSDKASSSSLQNGLAFGSFIMKQGLAFEAHVMALLKVKHKKALITIPSPYCKPENLAKKYQKQLVLTTQAMMKGIPIITQGLVYNPQNKTYGYPDLLVRSDYFRELVSQPPQIKSYGSRFSTDWHYRVIDIKFATLHMTVDEKHLLNQGSTLAYKGQLCIYNEALAYMQDHVPKKAFIMGRGWKTTHDSEGEIFSRLGHIDFSGRDIDHVESTYAAIEWIRDLRTEGSTWEVLPVPSRAELYPNMSNTNDSGWHKAKKQIAEELSDLTEIWYCGPTQREFAHEKGIYSWKDPLCNSQNLGMKQGGKIATLVDKIIQINQGEEILSQITVEDDDKWKYDPEYFNCYLDFETVSSIGDVTSSKNGNLIFMIGLYYPTMEEEFIYQDWTVDALTLEEEKRMTINFLNFLQQAAGKRPIRVYHYSHAEITHYNSTIARHNLYSLQSQIEWIDLYTVIQKRQLVIKGAFDYSLKSIVAALSAHGKIDINYQGLQVQSGTQAMIAAFIANLDSKEIPLSKQETIGHVREYNKCDCQTMHQVVLALGEIIN